MKLALFLDNLVSQEREMVTKEMGYGELKMALVQLLIIQFSYFLCHCNPQELYIIKISLFVFAGCLYRSQEVKRSRDHGIEDEVPYFTYTFLYFIII